MAFVQNAEQLLQLCRNQLMPGPQVGAIQGPLESESEHTQPGVVLGAKDCDPGFPAETVGWYA